MGDQINANNIFHLAPINIQNINITRPLCQK